MGRERDTEGDREIERERRKKGRVRVRKRDCMGGRGRRVKKREKR